VPLLLSALLIPLVGAPLFLLPVHLVWLELIVHPTSALVFENDPAAPGLMRRAPRLRNAGLLQAGDWARPLALGVALSVGVIVLYLWALHAGAPTDAARSLALAARCSWGR
jgi:Ca2+-transporting ATPase